MKRSVIEKKKSSGPQCGQDRSDIKFIDIATVLNEDIRAVTVQMKRISSSQNYYTCIMAS